MSKEFVPYELAIKLKELGFDEGCLDQYTSNGEFSKLKVGFIVKNQLLTKLSCSSPLYQQAFRWFRDVKLSDSYIYRYQDRTDGSINFGYSIIHDYGIEECRFIKENYFSYEEAELACLEKLIEIVKGGNK